MVKKIVEDRLKDIPKYELDKAQEQLNQLCDKHNLKIMKLTSGRADWRELCFRILGLPAAKKETKKEKREKLSKQLELQVFNAVIDYSIGYDNLKGKALYEKVAKELNIKPQPKPGGGFTKPAEVVRGIDDRYKRILKKKRNQK